MKKYLIIICIAFLNSFAQGTSTSLKELYFAQTPPENDAEVFAPGIITTGANELNICFSPAGDEMYFFVTGPRYNPRIILHSRIVDNEWITPVELPFHDEKRTDSYPFITPDGSRIFFNSSRDYEGKKESIGHHHEIWFAEKEGNNWGSPKRVVFEGNFSGFGTFPSVASNGNLYFNASIENDDSDIYVSEFRNGKYSTPVRLSDEVNSTSRDFHPYISPDESFILFDSQRKEDSRGSQDIYISFRDENGNWTKAMNLGDKINGPGWDLRPFLTFDGKYLFFISDRMTSEEIPNESLSMNQVLNLINGSGNGSQDIYWIKADFIWELKNERIKKE